MDEATVGLDPASRAQLLDDVRRGCVDEGRAVLWATHLTEEAERADRVIVLHRGSVLYDGGVAGLLERTETDGRGRVPRTDAAAPGDEDETGGNGMTLVIGSERRPIGSALPAGRICPGVGPAGPVAPALAALVVVAAALTGSLPAAAAPTGLAYVSSEKDNAITMIDVKTHAVTGTIATCKRPRHMQFLPGDERLLVVCSDSDRADLIDLPTRKSVDRMPLGEDPEVFDLSPTARPSTSRTRTTRS